MDIDRELKLVELKKYIDKLTYETTRQLLLMYMKAEDDNVKAMIDNVFLICSQLLQNYNNPRGIIILLKYLISDCRRLGVTVDTELVKRIIDLSSELIT
ncbi:MAG: hypothetical protein QXK07_05920 [Desulfurococcaceae archaeon]